MEDDFDRLIEEVKTYFPLESSIFHRDWDRAQRELDNLPYGINHVFKGYTIAHCAGRVHMHEAGPSEKQLAFIRAVIAQPDFDPTTLDSEGRTASEWALEFDNRPAADLLKPA